MAETDNKLLNGQGLRHLASTIKQEIADKTEVFIGSSTPSTDEYKVWINPDGDPQTVYTKTETDTLLADKQHTLTAGTNITIANNVISASGEPNTYIKSASVNNKTLTLTNKDDSTTTFTDTGSVVSVSSTGTATDEVQYITVDGVEKKLAGGGGSAPSNMVTTDTAQTISGSKKFSSSIYLNGSYKNIYFDNTGSSSYIGDSLHSLMLRGGSNYANTILFINVGGVYATGTNGVNLGTPNYEWSNGYINTIYSNSITASDLIIYQGQFLAPIPQCPRTTDGTFVLKCTVTSGIRTYTWVQEV